MSKGREFKQILENLRVLLMVYECGRSQMYSEALTCRALYVITNLEFNVKMYIKST